MRKRCTRQHFIEYLGYNYVEKQCLLASCLWQRHSSDYGLDGYIRTTNELGEVERGEIDVQVKATEQDKRLKKTSGYYYDLPVRDIESWLSYAAMTVLVLYLRSEDKAYYIEISEYFKENKESLKKANKFVRVYIPVANVFDASAVRKLRMRKNQ